MIANASPSTSLAITEPAPVIAPAPILTGAIREVLEPIKRKGNRRYYTQNDILTILKISDLISSHGFTIEGAKQKLLSTPSSSNKEDPTYALLKKDIQNILDVLDK